MKKNFKKILLSLGLSLAGALIVALGLVFMEKLPDIVYKFIIFAGDIFFGAGIACLFLIRNKSRYIPPDDEEDSD